MPTITAPKTDVVFRTAKPKKKPYLIADGDGLCLQISPDGVKRWLFRYRFDGKERKISLKNNLYPSMSAKLARAGAEQFREMIARGEDPGRVRKVAKAQERIAATEARMMQKAQVTTFKLVADEWIERHMASRADVTKKNARLRLERHVYPWIGERPIAEITAAELLTMVERIAKEGKLDSAHRLLRRCGQVFRYAVVTQRAVRDVASDLKGAIAPAVAGHRAAIIDPKEFGILLRDLDTYQGWISTQYALRLLPLVFTRPGELRLAEWTEFDFERNVWDIPVGRMKMKNPHTVPLSRQVLVLLEELQRYTGEGRFLFPSPRQKEKPISNMAMLSGLRRLGYGTEEVSAHGFRASARTLLAERLEVNPAYIEAQLAHKVADSLGTAYNRTQFLDARKDMMQTWADYLDTLKAGASSYTR